MGENSDSRLARRKAQFASEPHVTWSEPRRQKFLRQFSPAWAIEPSPDASLPTVYLRLLRHDLRAWRNVIQAIQTIEGTSGAAIDTLDVQADGAGSRRRLTQVTISLRLH